MITKKSYIYYLFVTFTHAGMTENSAIKALKNNISIITQ